MFLPYSTFDQHLLNYPTTYYSTPIILNLRLISLVLPTIMFVALVLFLLCWFIVS